MSSIGNREVFSKNLTYYMERMGKSQKEMAEIIGVAASTFNNWATGKKYPRIDKIEMLANYFGILKSDLIEDKENSPDEMQLNEGEKKLLELFRLIPEDQQPMVLEMIRAALRTKR